MQVKKVLLAGRFGVGKTSLIRRFVQQEFSEEYISTIGVLVSAKVVNLDGEEIKLMIWDVAGTNGEDKIPKSYFLGAHAAMYVFDLSNPESYEDLEDQLAVVKLASGLKEWVVVGNKKDLLSSEEIAELKKSISVQPDFITSAKEDENVEDAFYLLAQRSLS